MSNTYFQFKQFRIAQDQCAMKVSTDACIQGAWSPVPAIATRVLDIGAGTGLLSLLLAQRFPHLDIDAIEQDEAAMRQSAENVEASPFAARIHLLQGDVRSYPFGERYDYMICNPPFFQNSLLGKREARNAARHNVTLSLEDLFEVIRDNLAPTGIASILLPPDIQGQWLQLLNQQGWHYFGALHIRHAPDARINRICGLYSPALQQDFIREELFIKDAAGNYSLPFQKLLRDFYLYL